MAKKDQIVTLKNHRTGEIKKINISELVRAWLQDAPGILDRIMAVPAPARLIVADQLGYNTPAHHRLFGL